MGERTCSIEGCDSPTRSRGWCAGHYHRWFRLGDPGPATFNRRRTGPQVVDGAKECSTCRQTKPVGDFNSSKKNSDGYASSCRVCLRLRGRARTYGLSLPELIRMEAEAKGVCAICKEPAARLCVDHCHDSDQVRELLCQSCNQAIGFLCDDPVRARAAAAYLEKWSHLKEADSGC